MPLPPVGTQLIVFGGKYNVERDIEAILDTLQKAGYDGVEGGPKDAQAYRKMLDARGLRYSGAHVTLPNLADVTSLVADLKTLGSSDVCNSGLLSWNDRTAGDYRASIAALNEAGRKLRAQGIHLHYHNHDFEFEKVEGDKTGMDLLIEGLDPQACDLCVDVAWVQKGGHNPVEFLERHKAIIGYVHLKDFDSEGWTELGRGEVDLGAIVKQLETMPDVRWAVAEQDKTRNDAMDSVTESRRYLRDKLNY